MRRIHQISRSLSLGTMLAAAWLAGAGCGSSSPGPADDMGPGNNTDLAGAQHSTDLAHTTIQPDLANPAKLSCTSTSPCWDNCVINNISFSTCKSNCGLGDGVSCWQLCTQQGVSFSTC